MYAASSTREQRPRFWMVRTRWAAVGAAVAVVLGTGGIAVSGASNPQVVPSKVNITPCRLLDTRGTKGGFPLGTGETRTIQVTGRTGDCNIPPDAVGVMVNVTLVTPQQGGFITVFPAGATRPNASNLNYVAGQAPTPNLVDATLGSDGRLSFFASAGPVHLVADISSYTTGARMSPDQVAQQRWDLDRTRPLSPDLRSTGFAGPRAVLHDGANLWIASSTAGGLTRLNPVTGAVTGVMPAAGSPSALGFDGTNVWTANSTAGTVTRYTTGSVTSLGDTVVGAGPIAMAFDGAVMWTANFDAGTVSRVVASTGTRITPDIAVGTNPIALAFDGAVLWVANRGSNTLSRIQTTTGNKLPDVAMAGGPNGLAFDGANLWVTNGSNNTVSRVSPASATKNLADIAVGGIPRAVQFDGNSIWVASSDTGELTRIDAATGAKTSLGTVLGALPLSMSFDGANLWVANFGSDTVQRLRAPR